MLGRDKFAVVGVSQRGYLDHAPDARLQAGAEQRQRRLLVDRRVGVGAALAQDARTVDHRLDTGEAV